MTREEFIRRLGIVQDRIDKVYKALNTTDIPAYEYIKYLKDEIGIDLENDSYYK